ncbi:arylamine N-acetyltransferase family protein [Staphylococcus edaphicus]|uniref:Arylamine N-acetyltransferase n=1 Tax=Staphylococcus edaphicus TaxID=1955013 RepID=A0A2C6WIU4_9STAP|nr:arylamine N-acetyltransferase [Staphylococcus edaphicus]PHK49020.1 arylamine N-acetyltransferase [Staphylococcus edaphicus]UQW81345.1 arylamine N-acetyltransferase [Staphylococcus edaphicus]
MTDFKKLEDYLNINTEIYHHNDLRTLNHYIDKYVSNVPFENINVQNKQPIALDDESMMHKIIVEHRGGFCYEQNHLFHHWITAKGFDAYIISATINTGTGWAMEGSHMALIVDIEGNKYLVDVGYADVPKQAMPITDESCFVSDVSGDFQARWIDANTIEMSKHTDGSSEIQYRAIDCAKTITCFEEAIQFNQYDQASIFVKKLIVSKAKSYGRVTLSNEHLTITHHSKKEKIPVTQDNYQALLKDYFGIENIKIQIFM